MPLLESLTFFCLFLCRRTSAATQVQSSGCLTRRPTKAQISSSKIPLFAWWVSATERPTRTGWDRATWTRWLKWSATHRVQVRITQRTRLLCTCWLQSLHICCYSDVVRMAAAAAQLHADQLLDVKTRPDTQASFRFPALFFFFFFLLTHSVSLDLFYLILKCKRTPYWSRFV